MTDLANERDAEAFMDRQDRKQAGREAFRDDYVRDSLKDKGAVADLFERFPSDFAKLYLMKEDMTAHLTYLFEEDSEEVYNHQFGER